MSGRGSRRNKDKAGQKRAGTSDNDENARKLRRTEAKSSSLSVPVGEHHDGDFGIYMGHKKAKLDDQFDAHGAPRQVSEIFVGCNVHVNGHTEPSLEEIRQIMAEHGGRFDQYLGRRVTHVVASNLPDGKLFAMLKTKRRVKVVTPDWVVACLSAGRRVPEGPFIHSAFVGGDSARTMDQWTTRSEEDDEEEEEEVEKAAPNTQESFEEDDDTTKEYTATTKKHTTTTTKNDTDPKPSGRRPESPGLMPPQARRPPPFAKTSETDPNYLRSYHEASRLSSLGRARGRSSAIVGATMARSLQEGGESKEDKVTPDATLEDEEEEEDVGRWEDEADGGEVIGTTAAHEDAVRVVAHVDMDCFFVQVALVKFPELRGKPVVVAHGESGTDIASVSYEAKKQGIRRGMSVAQAREKCPLVEVAPYLLDDVDRLSSQVMALLATCGARAVEPLSVDEAFLDLTGVPDPERLVERLRRSIVDTTGCTASAGLGPNKLLARVATRRAKPNGMVRFPDDPVVAARELASLPASELPGVGWRTAAELRERFGAESVADVRLLTRTQLQTAFGEKRGSELADAAMGIDDRPVGGRKPRATVGAEYNWGLRFSATEKALAFLDEVAHRVANRLVVAGVEDAAGRGMVDPQLYEDARLASDAGQLLPWPTDSMGDPPAAVLGPCALSPSRLEQVRLETQPFAYQTQQLTLKILKRKESVASSSSSRHHKHLGHGPAYTFSRSTRLTRPTRNPAELATAARALFVALDADKHLPAPELRGMGLSASQLHGGPKGATAEAGGMRTLQAMWTSSSSSSSSSSSKKPPPKPNQLPKKQSYFGPPSSNTGVLMEPPRHHAQDSFLDEQETKEDIPDDIEVVEEEEEDDLEVVEDSREREAAAVPVSASQIDMEVYETLPIEVQNEVRRSFGMGSGASSSRVGGGGGGGIGSVSAKRRSPTRRQQSSITALLGPTAMTSQEKEACEAAGYDMKVLSELAPRLRREMIETAVRRHSLRMEGISRKKHMSALPPAPEPERSHSPPTRLRPPSSPPHRPPTSSSSMLARPRSEPRQSSLRAAAAAVNPVHSSGAMAPPRLESEEREAVPSGVGARSTTSSLGAMASSWLGTLRSRPLLRPSQLEPMRPGLRWWVRELGRVPPRGTLRFVALLASELVAMGREADAVVLAHSLGRACSAADQAFEDDDASTQLDPVLDRSSPDSPPRVRRPGSPDTLSPNRGNRPKWVLVAAAFATALLAADRVRSGPGLSLEQPDEPLPSWAKLAIDVAQQEPVQQAASTQFGDEPPTSTIAAVRPFLEVIADSLGELPATWADLRRAWTAAADSNIIRNEWK